MNPFKTTSATQQESVAARELYAADFFNKETGYWSKDDFLAWGESARNSDVAEITKFIRLKKDGKKIIHIENTRIDAGKNPYEYVTFRRSADTTDGVKFITIGGWKRFLDDVADGLIKINFTLDELIAEARNA